MKHTSFPAIALALGLAMLAAPGKIQSQEKPSDRFNIALSRPVTIGSKVLLPGNYSVEPVSIAGGDTPALSISRIDADYSRKFETTAMIVPTARTGLQPATRVILRQVGHRYYFERIWVKGMMYGYDFPLPKGAKGRIREVQ